MYDSDLLCKKKLNYFLPNMNAQMFVFILTPNLNLHSGSGSKIWLNQTPNKMLGSCSNIVRNVRNRTAASLYGCLFFLLEEGGASHSAPLSAASNSRGLSLHSRPCRMCQAQIP